MLAPGGGVQGVQGVGAGQGGGDSSSTLTGRDRGGLVGGECSMSLVDRTQGYCVGRFEVSMKLSVVLPATGESIYLSF